LGSIHKYYEKDTTKLRKVVLHTTEEAIGKKFGKICET
jgi:hypothetical protein